MKTQQEQVAEFMKAAGQRVASLPAFPADVQLHLGINLIQEEFEELRHAAFETSDIVALFDGICDSIYVLLWLANAAGLPIDKGFDEVHRSNMTKFIDGYRDPETGKWRKGASHTPPQLANVLALEIARVGQEAVAEQLEFDFDKKS